MTTGRRSASPKPESDNAENNNGLASLVNSVTTEADKYKFQAAETKASDSMDPNQCLEVLTKYSQLHSIPIEATIAGITKLVQDGGTNQSKKSLTVTVGDYEFDLSKLRNILKSIDKNLTVRKFAKGARDLIIQVAILNGWAGPLLKELSRSQPNLSIPPSLAPWCLEIHSDNYACPNEIRDALVRREEQLKMLMKTKEVKKPQTRNNRNGKPRGRRGGKR